MSGRSVKGFGFRALIPVCGVCLAAACGSDPTDFFGTPNAAAGTGAAGSGATAAGTGGTDTTQGGTGGATAGSNSQTGGSGSGPNGGTGGSAPMGGSSNPAGGATNSGGSGGDKPSNGGSGGAPTDGGMSGDTNAGEPGAGGTQSAGGEAGTQGGPQGGMAGDPGSGGVGGSNGGTAGNAAGTGSQPGTCDGNEDCTSSQYCKKASCDAATGTCTALVAECKGANAAFSPLCGCDHMTYYNACVAEREGVNVATSGECQGTTVPCSRDAGSGDSCDPHRNFAECYRTRGVCNNNSPAPDEGVCWVLPDACADEDEAHLDCNSGDATCRGLCAALKQQRPLIRNSNQCD